MVGYSHQFMTPNSSRIERNVSLHGLGARDMRSRSFATMRVPEWRSLQERLGGQSKPLLGAGTTNRFFQRSSVMPSRMQNCDGGLTMKGCDASFC